MSWTHLEEEEETRNFHFRRPVNACEGEGMGPFRQKNGKFQGLSSPVVFGLGPSSCAEMRKWGTQSPRP